MASPQCQDLSSNATSSGRPFQTSQHNHSITAHCSMSCEITSKHSLFSIIPQKISGLVCLIHYNISSPYICGQHIELLLNSSVEWHWLTFIQNLGGATHCSICSMWIYSCYSLQQCSEVDTIAIPTYRWENRGPKNREFDHLQLQITQVVNSRGRFGPQALSCRARLNYLPHSLSPAWGGVLDFLCVFSWYSLSLFT